MANEIILGASLSHTKNGTTVQGSTSLAITQSGSKRIANVQAIGTTTEALVFGDVTPAYLYLKNLDSTNFVMVGLNATTSSGNAFLKLLPGEVFSGHVAQSTIYAIADTASCNLEVVAIEL
jgi:hypothetical protein